MPRMIELMKQSAVPANIMRSAARGALELPPAEMIEILVFLTSSPIFGQQARFTLAGWDVTACLAVCSDAATPPEVLDYFTAPENRRPKLVPALIENPSVPEAVLLNMAQEHSPEMLEWLLGSARVMASLNVLHALITNPVLGPAQAEQITAAIAALGGTAPEAATATEESAELDLQVQQFVTEHAAEIAADEGKEFQLIGGAETEEAPAEAAGAPSNPDVGLGGILAAGAPSTPDVSLGGGLAAAAQAKKDTADEQARMSPLQRISQLTVGQRVQLAMKGNKEERYILVRDGSKVVSSAVLESPKLTEQEIELFASLKNVQESVLRGIASKRKFMKTYGVVRALANNPRCPLDIQLTIAKNLLNNDLRALSVNKNISETVRKLALKMFKERTEKKKGAFE